MSELSAAALKLFFETGDKPTAAQFADFIESYSNTIDKGNSVTKVFGEFANDATTTGGIETLGTPFSLPANTILTAGQAIRVTAWGTDVATANTKNVGFSFGTTTKLISLSSAPQFLGTWFMELLILVNTAALQRSILNVNWGRQNMSAGTPRPGLDTTSISEDLTTALDIKILAQDNSGSEPITLDSWIVEILR